FRGTKLGDSQRGYDIVVTSREAFFATLGRLAVAARLEDRKPTSQICIEVRSKMNQTPTGKATVVQCKPSNLEAMTHLAIVLVHPGSRVAAGDSADEGRILAAWLMTCEKASTLREKPGREQYIRVNQVRKAIQDREPGVIDIAPLLASIADAPLDTG